MNLEELNDYDFEVNQKEIRNYLHGSWNINYSPNVSKMLFDFRVDSLSVPEFFEVLIKLRNACQLSYFKEWNCVRIVQYNPSFPNIDSARMMDDLFEFYDSEQWVIEHK